MNLSYFGVLQRESWTLYTVNVPQILKAVLVIF